MCGYDPFWFYNLQLDRQYEAEQAGYDNYEDYYNARQDDLMNDECDRYADDQVEKSYKQKEDEDLKVPF